jgi:hypothetical protein
MTSLLNPGTGAIAWLVVLLSAFLLGPFPYWPSFFRIAWFVVSKPMPIRAKVQQIGFLLVVFVSVPFRTLFWYLDELLFPGYRKIAIEPIFIIGEPRCGSTLLHRTLAKAEQHFFAVRHLEWRFPFLSIQLPITWFGLRKFLGGISYWPDSSVGNLAARMHPNRLDDWEEDGIFFEELFCHHFFIFLRFPYPELLAIVDTFEQLPSAAKKRLLKFHHKAIQKVSYLRQKKPRFYLSKEVTSHEKIPALLELYPNARFIVLVRESKDFMSSLLALMEASTSAKNAGYDPTIDPDWLPTVQGRMRDDCERLVRLCENIIPPDQQIGLYSVDLFNNIESTVERIYDWLNIPLDANQQKELASLSKQQLQRDKGYSNSVQTYDGFENYDNLVRLYAESAFKS